MRDIDCLRCGARMKYMFRENLQLGKTGWILGDLPNLFAGALCADILSARTAASSSFISRRAMTVPRTTSCRKRPAPTAAKR